MTVKKTGNELSISEFAALMGTSRQTLIYYDRIGLLPPARVDPHTGYRRYDRRQIGVLSLIQTLSGLGVPLAEIRHELAGVSPGRMEAVLRRQRQVLRAEREKLRRREAMIGLRLAQIAESRAAREGTAALVRETEPVPLFVSGPVHCPKSAVPDRLVVDFYAAADRQGLPMGYPMGYLVSAADIAAGRAVMASRLAFHLGSADGANRFLPAGLRLVAWERSECGGTPAAYARLLAEASRRGLRPAGGAFEEYLLDETTCARPQDFLVRLALPVEA